MDKGQKGMDGNWRGVDTKAHLPVSSAWHLAVHRNPYHGSGVAQQNNSNIHVTKGEQPWTNHDTGDYEEQSSVAHVAGFL
jgi:hypothetical protein